MSEASIACCASSSASRSIACVFVGPQTPWGWVGLVPLLTGLVRFCPAYTLLGFNSCARK